MGLITLDAFAGFYFLTNLVSNVSLWETKNSEWLGSFSPLIQFSKKNTLEERFVRKLKQVSDTTAVCFKAEVHFSATTGDCKNRHRRIPRLGYRLLELKIHKIKYIMSL